MSSGQHSTRRIAVISDLHSNADALAAALTMAEREGYDCLAILGDLFSYGCRPVRVLAMVQEVISQREVVLLLGNHDTFYLPPRPGCTSDPSRLPDWLRESIEWTGEQLASETSLSALPWQEQVRWGPILLAHANPFGFGDWTYLEDRDALGRAGLVVAEYGASVGVFGHTHRSRTVRVDAHGDVHATSTDRWYVAAGDCVGTLVVNPGSVGQPRCAARQSTMLIMTVTDRTVAGRCISIPYDVGSHKRAIEESSLTTKTKQKLNEFFARAHRVAG